MDLRTRRSVWGHSTTQGQEHVSLKGDSPAQGHVDLEDRLLPPPTHVGEGGHVVAVHDPGGDHQGPVQHLCEGQRPQEVVRLVPEATCRPEERVGGADTCGQVFLLMGGATIIKTPGDVIMSPGEVKPKDQRSLPMQGQYSTYPLGSQLTPAHTWSQETSTNTNINTNNRDIIVYVS